MKIQVRELLTKEDLKKLPEGVGNLKISSRYKNCPKSWTFYGEELFIAKDWFDTIFFGNFGNGAIMRISRGNLSKGIVTSKEFNADGEIVYKKKIQLPLPRIRY